MMTLYQLQLTRSDLKSLKVTDAYSIHRIVYGLFSDIRTDEQKRSGEFSGILYSDKGFNTKGRHIVILANRTPTPPQYGSLILGNPFPESFLEHKHYAFSVRINPTKRDKNSRKLIALKKADEIMPWFIQKSPQSWGFTVDPHSFSIEKIGVQRFEKAGHSVTQGYAELKGRLEVSHRESFIRSFQQGIGRGSAFGFGLLEIMPLAHPI